MLRDDAHKRLARLALPLRLAHAADVEVGRRVDIVEDDDDVEGRQPKARAEGSEV
jgi:hypothetical protein